MPTILPAVMRIRNSNSVDIQGPYIVVEPARARLYRQQMSAGACLPAQSADALALGRTNAVDVRRGNR